MNMLSKSRFKLVTMDNCNTRSYIVGLASSRVLLIDLRVKQGLTSFSVIFQLHNSRKNAYKLQGRNQTEDMLLVRYTIWIA